MGKVQFSKEDVRMKRRIAILMSFIVANYGIALGLQRINEVLLKGTIEASRSLVAPSTDATVTYNQETKELYVKFTTPSWYKVNYGNFYLRWRVNQWVVLQEFIKAGIPVAKVTVETNYDDGSGQLRFTHLSEHVLKYAKLPNDDLWLRTGTGSQKSKGSDIWEKVRY